MVRHLYDLPSGSCREAKCPPDTIHSCCNITGSIPYAALHIPGTTELEIHWVNKVLIVQRGKKEHDFYDLGAGVMSFLNNTQCSRSRIPCVTHILPSHSFRLSKWHWFRETLNATYSLNLQAFFFSFLQTFLQSFPCFLSLGVGEPGTGRKVGC